MTWTEENVARLKQMWKDGESCSTIARVLQQGITRNAVIGKVHRLGLGSRPTPSRPRTVPKFKRPAVRQTANAAPKLSIVPLPPSPPVPATALRLTLMQLTDQTCKCPLGDPREPDFAFCGLPVKQGSRYCAEHHSRFYSTIRTENAKKREVQKPRRQSGPDFWRHAA
jgi:GcrA cell cycle regulator